jgi:hypothetical protein
VFHFWVNGICPENRDSWGVVLIVFFLTLDSAKYVVAVFEPSLMTPNSRATLFTMNSVHLGE